MKIEISHDTLAKKVYEKASAEDRMRLRVINFIKAKHHFFEQQRVYLTAEELKFIAPFEKQIDLLDAEKVFITRSKWLARKQMIILGVGVFILIAILSFSLKEYRNTSIELVRANDGLYLKNKDLVYAKDSIEQLVDFLLQQDSIQDDLRLKIQNRDSTITMTKAELQVALQELQLKNEELKMVNNALEKSRKDLEKERDKLKKDNTELVLKLKNKTNSNTTSSLEQSQKLSQQARAVLESSAKPSDNQYQEAFKLARAAWEMNNNNNQAMDVLNEIKNVKIQSNNGSFLNNTRPKYTYTQSQIESMIKELDKKYNYGKLNPTETKLRLNTK